MLKSILFSFFLTALSYAQIPDSLSYFPHSLGNVWQYRDYLCSMTGDTTQQRIVYDSTDLNGIRYVTMLYPPCRADVKYYTIYGDTIVYESDYPDFSEPRTLFKFNVPVGSKWIYERYPNGVTFSMVKVREEYWDCWFKCDTIKRFTMYLTGDTITDSLSYVLMDIYMLKGLGLFWSNEEPLAPARVLMGARIAGNTYGIINSIGNQYGSNFRNSQFLLRQNFPNPFNPSTTISFSLNSKMPLSLEVFNINGQLIRTLLRGNLPSGTHNIVWDGKNSLGHSVSSGVYISRLTVGSKTQARKMLLIR